MYYIVVKLEWYSVEGPRPPRHNYPILNRTYLNLLDPGSNLGPHKIVLTYKYQPPKYTRVLTSRPMHYEKSLFFEVRNEPSVAHLLY